ncbi:MAG: beta-propeller domain-containing protein [bacterium]
MRRHNNKGIILLAAAFITGICILTVSCRDTNNSKDSSSGQNTIVKPTSKGRQLAALTPVEDCDDLLASFKAAAMRDMEDKIDSYKAQVADCNGCCYPYYYEGYGDGASLPPKSTGSTGGAAGSEATGDNGEADQQSASEHSTTNNQVPGVDEADFVKNDGSYIYILANNKFQIIAAWPADSADVISNTEIEGTPRKLFVDPDSARAVVYSSLDPVHENEKPYPAYDGYISPYDECVYGYDCDFAGDNLNLKITVYDISNPASPFLLREIRFKGSSYINSRRIGKAVHTVILSPAFQSPEIKYWPELWQKCWSTTDPSEKPKLEELLAAFDELKQTNREIIDQTAITDWLPTIEDKRYQNGETITTETLLQDCNSIDTSSSFYAVNSSDNQSFLTVFSFDIDQLEEPRKATIFGRPGAVYSSASALYVAARQGYRYGYDWYYDPASQITEASTIHKFRLTSEPAAGCEYSSSGVVKGRVLNQFSLDEYQGCLRIATTTGHLPGPDVHSTMSILKEEAQGLEVVGQVDNIAPSEDIRSVRFDGLRAFVVTFKKTDPLFAFNLSDPNTPRIEGELKIPGYSTYMHLMDANHLLTIGYDAEDQGTFSLFQGIMLQIFDISDMAHPKRLYNVIKGTRGSSSEAALNHLAFTYFSPKDRPNLLAIPITICEDEQGSYYGTQMAFSGLLVYEVTLENGFSELGGVSHVDPDSAESYTLCSSWWTQPNSIVKRSIFMGNYTDNYIYSIALDQIKIQSVDNLGTDTCVIDLMKE